MTKKLEEAIKMFGITCGYDVKTPGAPHLWEINDNAEKLDTEKSKIFHSVVANLLYVMKRTRPDVEPEVPYFTTRLSNSSVDDLKKMRRCTASLKKYKEDKQIIGCLNLKEFFTWVDVSFDVHPNMRSHTGGGMPMGYVIIHCCSRN